VQTPHHWPAVLGVGRLPASKRASAHPPREPAVPKCTQATIELAFIAPAPARLQTAAAGLGGRQVLSERRGGVVVRVVVQTDRQAVRQAPPCVGWCSNVKAPMTNDHWAMSTHWWCVTGLHDVARSCADALLLGTIETDDWQPDGWQIKQHEAEPLRCRGSRRLTQSHARPLDYVRWIHLVAFGPSKRNNIRQSVNQ